MSEVFLSDPVVLGELLIEVDLLARVDCGMVVEFILIIFIDAHRNVVLEPDPEKPQLLHIG